MSIASSVPVTDPNENYIALYDASKELDFVPFAETTHQQHGMQILHFFRADGSTLRIVRRDRIGQRFEVLFQYSSALNAGYTGKSADELRRVVIEGII
jgi:hypothetical protein